MQIGVTLATYLKAMKAKGMNEFEAMRTPEAQRAYEADQRLAEQSLSKRSADDWIAGLPKDAYGNPKVRFESAEEREAAFADPLYQSSPGYREAVARMTANTSAETLGVHVDKGRYHGTIQGTDKNSMLIAAREDAARAHVETLFARANRKGPNGQDTPEARLARLEIVEMLSSDDPATQAMVSYAEGAHGQGRRPVEEALRANKGFNRTYDEAAPRHPKDIRYDGSNQLEDGTIIE